METEAPPLPLVKRANVTANSPNVNPPILTNEVVNPVLRGEHAGFSAAGDLDATIASACESAQGGCPVAISREVKPEKCI